MLLRYRPLLILAILTMLLLAHHQKALPQETLTAENWAPSVGFAPNLKVEGYEPGMEIDKDNLEKFTAIVPEAAQVMIKNYGMVIQTAPYKPYRPSDGFIALTNQYRGKARLEDTGGDIDKRELVDYQGGMPFPAPKNGREIAWNYTLAYGGDDSESVFDVRWISAKRGVERAETWKTTSIHRAKYRSDISPKPAVPFLESKGVIAATLTQALAPQDKKGFTSLYYGYIEPKEPNGWLYIPAQRRSIRLTFGMKGESWNSTDLLYEDVRGYTGSPEWMNWKLVEKTTMLCPAHSGIQLGKENANSVYDFENAPHWNPKMKWELRPVYVLEATPRIKGYPYSRMRFTVDAESSHIFTKVAYDRKGMLWKVLLQAGVSSKNPATNPGSPGMVLVVDIQSEHGTAFFWDQYKSNQGPDPTIFSQTTLRKIGR